MLLRSSSTPVLGSLLSSVAESPNNDNHHHGSSCSPLRHYYPSNSFHHNHNRLSFQPSPGSVHLPTTFSGGSSPISPSFVDFDRKGFRRAHSEGNLEQLVDEELYNHRQPKKHSTKDKCLRLQTIPSFSFYNSRARCEEEEEEEDALKENEELLESREERVMAMSGTGSHMLLNEQVKVGFEDERGLVDQETFLAREGNSTGSVGGGGGDGDGGGGLNPAGSSGDGGDNHQVEESYKRMLEENPDNPLFLANYAQFMYQSKRDLVGAEEYYSRAILADPNDGETLSQYAKLVWELHHDEERALSYFERAVQASPQDWYVLLFNSRPN
ncbi:hypothetical protein PTKIN_Ptkin12aG0092700 [Pterospermum kingtungense]